MKDFVHLHCHTEYSLLDGMPKVEEYVIRCNELKMPAIAITEHGNMRSMFMLKQKTCTAFDFKGQRYDFKPIKPIFGIEFYVSPRDYTLLGLPESEKNKIRASCKNPNEYKIKLQQAEEELGVRKRFHLLCLVINKKGLENVFYLHYLSWKNGFYYRPRIDLNLLFKYNEGLLVTTACLGGQAPQYVLKSKFDSAEKYLLKMKSVFKDRLYIEIQPNAIPDQISTNKIMVELAHQLKIPLVATNDCHYLLKEDVSAHEVLLAIQSRKPMQAADRWRFDDTSFYMKSGDEMYESFRRHHPNIATRDIEQALGNTLRIAEVCNAGAELEINYMKNILPDTAKVIPTGFTVDKYFSNIIKENWKRRNMPQVIQWYCNSTGEDYQVAYKMYLDRVTYEIEAINQLNFTKYFLVIYDVVNWARSQGIFTGARGSSGGSLICFILGITSVDPILNGLYFERFINPNRKDYPDIDLDIQQDRRGEVIQHFYDTFGEENCAGIGTVAMMKGKMATLDVGRVLGVPPARTHEINKHLVVRSSGDARASQTVEDSFKEQEICKRYNSDFPDVLKYVRYLEGRARQVGVHAAGLQVTPQPIWKYVPIEFRHDKTLETKTDKPAKVTGLNWLECSGFGLIKFDLLGLMAYKILSNTAQLVKENHGQELDFYSLSPNDAATLQGFTDANFAGIFQFDSIGMTNLCRGKMTFTEFEDIIALNALYRPATMRSGLATHYIARKSGIEDTPMIHPIYDEIVAKTYGILIYQEQIMYCFMRMANYHPGDADVLRRKIAKSYGLETMKKEEDIFIDGARENGMSDRDARRIFTVIAHSGSYCFNKSHAAAYAMVAYWNMYAKTYFPTEFMAALISNEHDAKSIGHYIQEARRLGIEVKMPDVNLSKLNYSISGKKTIVAGLLDIKGVGRKAADEILRVRTNTKPFTSISNIRQRVEKRKVHRGVIAALVHSNALGSIYPNLHALERNVGTKEHPVTFWEWAITKESEKSELETYQKVSAQTSPYTNEQFMRTVKKFCNVPTKEHVMVYYQEILSQFPYSVTYCGEIDWECGPESVPLILAGEILDVKYNSVGDFHIEEVTDEEKERIGWGKRYANFNIGDQTGVQRIKLGIENFDYFRHIIDKGVGTLVAISGRSYAPNRMVYADLILDLDNFREKFKMAGLVESTKLLTGDDLKAAKNTLYSQLGVYESYFMAHPIQSLRSKIPKNVKTIGELTTTTRFGIFPVAALITRIKYHQTRKNETMAFVDAEDQDKCAISFIAWPEDLKRNYKTLQPGAVVLINIKREMDSRNRGQISSFLYGTPKPILLKRFWKF